MKVILTCLFMLPGPIFFQEKTSTDALLKNAFDIQAFKKAKGPSNSGLADVQSY